MTFNFSGPAAHTQITKFTLAVNCRRRDANCVLMVIFLKSGVSGMDVIGSRATPASFSIRRMIYVQRVRRGPWGGGILGYRGGRWGGGNQHYLCLILVSVHPWSWDDCCGPSGGGPTPPISLPPLHYPKHTHSLTFLASSHWRSLASLITAIYFSCR